MHKHTYNKISGIRVVYRIDIGEKKRRRKQNKYTTAMNNKI